MLHNMAIKKTSRPHSASPSGHNIQDALSYHGNAITILSVFVVLTSFVFALWMLKTYVVELQLASALDVVAGKVMGQGAVGQTGSSNSLALVTKETAVPGLFADWKACDQGSVGHCDDYLLYRRIDSGGKNVVFASMRRLFPGGELPIPNRNSHEANYLVMSPPVTDGGGPLRLVPLSAAYLVDIFKGEVKSVTQPITVDAVYSPDNLFAAYVKGQVDKNGVVDFRQVIVVDLLHDKSKMVVTAKGGNTLWDGTDIPTIKSVDGTSVTFDVFTKVKGEIVFKETQTMKFKF